MRQTPFDGFFGVKFDILKPRWLPTAGDPFERAHLEAMKRMQEVWQRSNTPPLSSLLDKTAFLSKFDEKDRSMIESLLAGELKEEQLIPQLAPGLR